MDASVLVDGKYQTVPRREDADSSQGKLFPVITPAKKRHERQGRRVGEAEVVLFSTYNDGRVVSPNLRVAGVRDERDPKKRSGQTIERESEPGRDLGPSAAGNSNP